MRPYPTPWDHDLNKVDSTLPNVFLHKRFSYSGHTSFEKSFKNISLFIPE